MSGHIARRVGRCKKIIKNDSVFEKDGWEIFSLINFLNLQMKSGKWHFFHWNSDYELPYDTANNIVPALSSFFFDYLSVVNNMSPVLNIVSHLSSRLGGLIYIDRAVWRYQLRTQQSQRRRCCTDASQRKSHAPPAVHPYLPFRSFDSQTKEPALTVSTRYCAMECLCIYILHTLHREAAGSGFEASRK